MEISSFNRYMTGACSKLLDAGGVNLWKYCHLQASFVDSRSWASNWCACLLHGGCHFVLLLDLMSLTELRYSLEDGFVTSRFLTDPCTHLGRSWAWRCGRRHLGRSFGNERSRSCIHANFTFPVFRDISTMKSATVRSLKNTQISQMYLS